MPPQLIGRDPRPRRVQDLVDRHHLRCDAALDGVPRETQRPHSRWRQQRDRVLESHERLVDHGRQHARAEPARKRTFDDRLQALVLELERDAVHLEEIALHAQRRMRGLVEQAQQVGLGERIERDDAGEPPDQLTQEPELDDVLGQDVRPQVGLAVEPRVGALADEPERPDRVDFASETLGDQGRDALERTRGQEQDAARVDPDLALAVLDLRAAAIEQREQAPLDPLARDIAADVERPPQLVELIQHDDALLGPLEVTLGGIEQRDQHALDRLPDIAGLDERGRGHPCDRHAEDAARDHDEERLADAGRAGEQAVMQAERAALGQRMEPVPQAELVVVERAAQLLLGAILTDDVDIELVEHLRGGQRAGDGDHGRGSPSSGMDRISPARADGRDMGRKARANGRGSRRALQINSTARGRACDA